MKNGIMITCKDATHLVVKKNHEALNMWDKMRLFMHLSMCKFCSLFEKHNKIIDERTRELAEANKELARLARLDGLTGIANHRRFREFFDQEWRRCLRAGQPLSIVMIDIDHFKQYNDRYGHQHGDDALRNVADIIQHATRRPGDLAARYGGEEFILVLTNTDQKGAVSLAESVRDDLFEAEIPHDGSAIGRITLSAGVTTVTPERDADPDGLVSRADDALYRAKDGGRNRVEVDG